MHIIGRISQTAAALWILNVWFNRFNKDTGYRGGDATNMREEFEEYGLSENQMYAVGCHEGGPCGSDADWSLRAQACSARLNRPRIVHAWCDRNAH